mmetsp:Transcript_1481/g.2694  ORF Transcript_1481/g.2694 Transcript_1481/m.2694 type:complete len:81 (+) Transcript_1481:2648-2890(+)
MTDSISPSEGSKIFVTGSVYIALASTNGNKDEIVNEAAREPRIRRLVLVVAVLLWMFVMMCSSQSLSPLLGIILVRLTSL